MRKLIKTTKDCWLNDRYKFWVNCLSAGFLLMSFVLVILLYATNRSLWADEATLAWSISERNLSNLTSEILWHRQSAPVLYVYIVKIITLIFSNNEYFLRIYSLFAYLGSLILSYQILKNMVKVRFPLLGPAFIGSMTIFIYFANEFKQYMSDAFTVLLVVYLFHLVEQKKIKLWTLFVLYSVVQWLSFPSLFYMAGLTAYLFFRELSRKNWPEFRQVIFGTILIVVSFVADYFYWLRDSSDNPRLVTFWDFYRFPVLPTSLEDLVRGARLVYGLTLSMNEYPVVDHSIRFYPVLIVLVVCFAMFSLFWKRNQTLEMITAGTFVALIASYIGKYPFHPRLMLMIYPIIGIFVIVAIDRAFDLTVGRKHTRALVTILILVLFAGNLSSLSYLKAENRLNAHEESKPLIQYVQANIKEDEVLHVVGADMNVRYLVGYEEELHIGNAIDPSIKNVRFGDLTFYETSLASSQEKNAYVLISHHNEIEIQELINPLLQDGYWEKVMEVAKTPLFYRAANMKAVRTRVRYRLENVSFTNNEAIGRLEIVNTGDTLLNGVPDYLLVLGSREIHGYFQPVGSYNIQPDSSIMVDFRIPFPQELDSIDLQLCYQDHYWFDEIGVAPVTLKR